MYEFPYRVKLPVYEGPLDLLIHLININEIDIYNIPIAKITNEYFEYINFMKELNLEVASEFILLAATLIYIKSKSLLPKLQEDLIEEDELDPQAELLELLLEHQKFKKTAEMLKQRSEERRQVWTRTLKDWEDKIEEDKLTEVGLFDLLSALKKVLQQREKTQPLSLKRKEYTLEEKIMELTEILAEKKQLSFSSFFKKLKTKIEIILYFLALLELVRRGKIKIYQKKPLEEIIIHAENPHLSHNKIAKTHTK
jgi:segregation and condensation protein A